MSNFYLNIDYHVTDRCNLNCVSCGHFCPLVPVTTKDISLEQAKKDLAHLYKVTDNGTKLTYVTLTGGECTMNKELPEIIDLAYSLFGDKVRMWSNCINLKLWTDKLLQTVKKYNLHINISDYFINDKDEITELFNKNGITNFSFYYRPYDKYDPKISGFFRYFFTEKKFDQHVMCNTVKVECVQLKDSKIYPCQYAAHLKYLKDAFPEEFARMNIREDQQMYLDISQDNVTFNDLAKFLIEYDTDLCQHCIDAYVDTIGYVPDERLQLWRRSRKKVDEWLIKDIDTMYRENMNKNGRLSISNQEENFKKLES